MNAISNLAHSKQYHTLLMDADDTLFDFEKAEMHALQTTLHQFHLPYHDEIRIFYREQNEALWRRLEAGEITKEELQQTRFLPLLQRFHSDLDAKKVNQHYLEALADSAFLLPDALAVCQQLSQRYRLVLATNGFSFVQRRRLERSPLKPYFSEVFVSEEIGFQKPQKEYYEYILRHLAISDRKGILIVGDSLTSDMQGGIRMGIDTCWFNRKKMQTELPCTYEIHELTELLSLLISSY